MEEPLRKVLIIDGEPVVRSVVSRILLHAGYSVKATDDIKTVLRDCRDDPPDLVLTNVLLPGITGHDAMRLIKENCPDMPVLMIAGLPSDPVIQHWINEDGFDIYPKPFTAPALIAKVQEMITGNLRPPRG